MNETTESNQLVGLFLFMLVLADEFLYVVFNICLWFLVYAEVYSHDHQKNK